MRHLVLALLGCLSASLFGACSLTIDEEALVGPNLNCSEVEKQCTVAGQAECVELNNPDFGCSGEGCAPCYLNKATATCGPPDGDCIIAACIGSWENCDRLDTNGCEVDLNTDPEHCGGCDDACPARAHAEIRCGSARCYIRVCDPGHGDCNEQITDGCETNLLTSEAHCGDCETPCAGQCVDGVCES